MLCVAAQSCLPELANRHHSIHRLKLFRLLRYGLGECLMNAFSPLALCLCLYHIQSSGAGAQHCQRSCNPIPQGNDCSLGLGLDFSLPSGCQRRKWPSHLVKTSQSHSVFGRQTENSCHQCNTDSFLLCFPLILIWFSSEVIPPAQYAAIVRFSWLQ